MTVVLDIGPGTGALVVNVPDDLLEQEVELSPVGRPRSRSHNVARRRHAPAGVVVAVVFPSVDPGAYDVRAPDGSLLATALVQAGRVTEVDRRDTG